MNLLPLAHAVRAPVTLIASALRASGSPKEQVTFTGAVEITAAAAEGQEGSRLRRFTMNAYDGSLMSVDAFFYPVVIDLAGARARRRVKAFYEHDRGRIVGHATKVSIDSSGIRVEGVISGSGEHVTQILEAADNGFEWESSVGASVIRRELVEMGESVTVNGRTFQGPIFVAREVEVYEASFTAIGAAEDSSARVAATGHSSGENAMTFAEWLQANGFDPAQISTQQRVTLMAAYAAHVQGTQPPAPANGNGGGAPAPQPPTPVQAGSAAPAPGTPGTPGTSGASGTAGTIQAQAAGSGVTEIRAEYARVASIQRICAAHGNPRITHESQEVSLEAHAIAEGWDTDQTELNALRASRPSGTAPFANVGRQGGPDQARVIEAAMCLTAGCSEEFIGEHYDENTVNAALSSRMRGFGIGELLFASLQANGGYVARGRIDSETITAALRTDPALNGGTAIHASFSTISLAGILSNVANRAMLERFEALESAVAEFCYESDTNNFKPFTRYRLDGKGNLSEVGPDGELKHIELAESEYSNQLKTTGGMLALNRQMIINDDLGAFLQLPLIFVELAVHAREVAAFMKLLGNAGNFFHADNGNYIEGAATVLSIDGLDAALQAYREQKNKGGHFIMASPRKVMVPPALEGTAKQIHTSTELRGQSSKSPVANHHAGAFRPVVSPYMGTAGGLDGASDKAWYLLPEPKSGHAVVQLGYLQGMRRPTLESGTADFNVLGIQWRCYWDFGAALFEPRAGVKSKGEA